MERVGTAADKLIANVVRIAYLVGMGLTFFAYFSGDFVNSPEIAWGLGIGLGVAFILHEFLVQRRVVSLWNKMSRLKKDTEERNHTQGQFFANLGISAVLLGADIFFGMLYYNALLLGQHLLNPTLEAVLRPCILGVLFWVSSLLSPVEDDPAQIIAETHQEMLLKLSKATRQQWNTRIDRAVDEGRNLAPVAADIMQLAGDEQRAYLMDNIEKSLAKSAPNSVPVRGVKLSTQHALPAPKKSGQKANRVSTQPSAYFEHQIEHPEVSTNRARPMLKLSVEKRVARYVKAHPEASAAMVASALGVSRNTVAKYRPSAQDLSSSSLLSGTED